MLSPNCGQTNRLSTVVGVWRSKTRLTSENTNFCTGFSWQEELQPVWRPSQRVGWDSDSHNWNAGQAVHRRISFFPNLDSCVTKDFTMSPSCGYGVVGGLINPPPPQRPTNPLTAAVHSSKAAIIHYSQLAEVQSPVVVKWPTDYSCSCSRRHNTADNDSQLWLARRSCLNDSVLTVIAILPNWWLAEREQTFYSAFISWTIHVKALASKVWREWSNI